MGVISAYSFAYVIYVWKCMVFMIKSTNITTHIVVVSLIYLEHVYMNIIVSTQALSRPFLWFRKTI